MRRRWLAAALCAALPARAHQQSVSVAELSVRGPRVEGRLRFAGADLSPLIRLELAQRFLQFIPVEHTAAKNRP